MFHIDIGQVFAKYMLLVTYICCHVFNFAFIGSVPITPHPPPPPPPPPQRPAATGPALGLPMQAFQQGVTAHWSQLGIRGCTQNPPTFKESCLPFRKLLPITSQPVALKGFQEFIGGGGLLGLLPQVIPPSAKLMHPPFQAHLCSPSQVT